MNNSEVCSVRESFQNWAESIEIHQRAIFEASSKFVAALKQGRISPKTKDEIAIVLKGLRATVKSISKVVGKYID